MCIASSIASGDPSRLTRWARQPPIERHAALCDYKWLPRHDPFVERVVKPRALFRQSPSAGFGLVQPSDLFASAKAARMNSSSRSVVMVQAYQTTRAWRDSDPQPSDPKSEALSG